MYLWKGDKSTAVAVMAKSVQNMTFERMAVGNAWVVKIFVGAAGHAEFFHDAPRPMIGDGGHRDDFVELQLLEAKLGGGASPFGRVTAAPMIRRQPPGDFDTGSEMGFKACVGQADEADKWGDVFDLDSPEAEPMLKKVLFDSRCYCCAFVRCE